MLVEAFVGEVTESKEGSLVWMGYDELKSVQLASIVAKLVSKLKEMKII